MSAKFSWCTRFKLITSHHRHRWCGTNKKSDQHTCSDVTWVETVRGDPGIYERKGLQGYDGRSLQPCPALTTCQEKSSRLVVQENPSETTSALRNLMALMIITHAKLCRVYCPLKTVKWCPGDETWNDVSFGLSDIAAAVRLVVPFRQRVIIPSGPPTLKHISNLEPYLKATEVLGKLL